MDLAADARDVDRPRVGSRIGVELETPELAGGFALIAPSLQSFFFHDKLEQLSQSPTFRVARNACE